MSSKAGTALRPKQSCVTWELAGAEKATLIDALARHSRSSPAENGQRASTLPKSAASAAISALPFATCHGQPLEVSGGLAGMLLEPQRPPLSEVLCGLGFHLLAVGRLERPTQCGNPGRGEEGAQRGGDFLDVTTGPFRPHEQGCDTVCFTAALDMFLAPARLLFGVGQCHGRDSVTQ